MFAALLHMLATPFVAYGHAWQACTVDGNAFVGVVLLIGLPALVIVGACALIDTMINP